MPLLTDQIVQKKSSSPAQATQRTVHPNLHLAYLLMEIICSELLCIDEYLLSLNKACDRFICFGSQSRSDRVFHIHGSFSFTRTEAGMRLSVSISNIALSFFIAHSMASAQTDEHKRFLSIVETGFEAIATPETFKDKIASTNCIAFAIIAAVDRPGSYHPRDYYQPR